MITKWRANDKYSYGYVRAEVLAGFINGLFLLFISFFIFSEAVERLVEPPEVKREKRMAMLYRPLARHNRTGFPPDDMTELETDIGVSDINLFKVKHERLLLVSILGFLVNMVGIFVFQHGGAGHGHSHGGGGDSGHEHRSDLLFVIVFLNLKEISYFVFSH